MKNNETGEFELVLGNNQLVVGFLIVALLFGVAFAMGYIVGRSSTPSARLQAQSADANSAAKDARPQPASPAPPVQTPAAPPSDQPPATVPDQAAAPAPTPADTNPAPVPTPAAPPPRETPAPAAAAATPAEPAPGSYWQVLATINHNSAEAMQQSLKDKGLPSTLSPGPNNLVRVLVGPYGDAQSLGRAKTVLETAGLHPVLKRE